MGGVEFVPRGLVQELHACRVHDASSKSATSGGDWILHPGRCGAKAVQVGACSRRAAGHRSVSGKPEGDLENGLKARPFRSPARISSDRFSGYSSGMQPTHATCQLRSLVPSPRIAVIGASGGWKRRYGALKTLLRSGGCRAAVRTFSISRVSPWSDRRPDAGGDGWVLCVGWHADRVLRVQPRLRG